VPTATARRPKIDAYLTGPEAVDRARAALDEITRPGDVGDFVGAEMVAERLATLTFACAMPGYAGWTWAVTVARFPRSRVPTVDETELLPGPQALLSPPWVPWAERLQPGDLGPGDVLPHLPDDPRLDPGFEQVGDDADVVGVEELGLGRARALSEVGRSEAATRWYSGRHGPTAAEAVKAAAPCSTCGFVTPLGGSLRILFGVCANEWSSSDGQVVSYDHGCGAHSETDVVRSNVEWPAPYALVDDSSVIPMDLGERQGAAAAQTPAAASSAEAEPAATPDSAGPPGAPGVDDGDASQGDAD
jgi:hypothetical protein